MSAPRAVLGVVLAGGASKRMPEGKPAAVLAGQSLLARAVAVVRDAGLEPVVCAPQGARLPEVHAPRWIEATEADAPRHPLAGIAWALEHAAAPIVVLPVDLPFLPSSALRDLAAAPSPGAVLGTGGRPAALVAQLHPHLAAPLRAAAREGAPALRTLLALGVTISELRVEPGSLSAAEALLNVNDPATLAEAERLAAELRSRANAPDPEPGGAA